jgi:hypothetical protein
MVRAPGHYLTASVVEDDHSVDAQSFFMEGEEVTKHHIMDKEKGCPPLIDDGFVTVELGLHDSIAFNVGDHGDRGRNLPEP